MLNSRRTEGQVGNPPHDEATRSAPELAFLDPLVQWVREKGLQAPAVFVLEMHRPLMPMAWPAAVLAGTVVAPFFGPDYYEKIEALRDPAALDGVLERLSAPQVAGVGEVKEKMLATKRHRRLRMVFQRVLLRFLCVFVAKNGVDR